MSEFLFRGVIKFAGQRFGRGRETQEGEMATHALAVEFSLSCAYLRERRVGDEINDHRPAFSAEDPRGRECFGTG